MKTAFWRPPKTHVNTVKTDAVTDLALGSGKAKEVEANRLRRLPHIQG